MSTNEINTQQCSQEEACVPSTASPCIKPGSCACGCTPCQCEGQRGTGVLPYYNQALSCQEDHTKVLIQQTFITAVAIGNQFNMPACGSAVTISIPGVQRLQVGGYLWNVSYGYLLITSFDFTQGTATVINQCHSGNASPGTQIPECTMFNVVDPPFETPGGCPDTGVFLIANFIAPAIAASVDIEVSSILGLTIGNTLQISTGTYLLAAIIDSNNITITNEGSGVAPGSTVSAFDILGNCITPITPFGNNPCINTGHDLGSVIVCNGEVAAPLIASANGQVPIVTDVFTNTVQYQKPYKAFVDNDSDCEVDTISPTAIFTSATRSITIENSTDSPMQLIVHVDYLIQGTFNVNEKAWAQTSFRPFFGFTTAALPGAPAAPVPTVVQTLVKDHVFGIGDGTLCQPYEANEYEIYHHTAIVTVAAQTAITLAAYFEYEYVAFIEGDDACCGCNPGNLVGTPTGNLSITGGCVDLNALGVSVEPTPP